MRSATVFVCFAVLAATSTAFNIQTPAKSSLWRQKFSRNLSGDACLTALETTSNCLGSWGGDDRTLPTGCCGTIDAVYAQCGNGSVAETVTNLLNKADTLIRDNATLPLMSLIGNCPRLGVSPSTCNASIANAQSCVDAEGGFACCSAISAQVQNCLGVPNATRDGFWESLMVQGDATGCAAFPESMCLAAINRLKRCRSLHGNSTSTGVCCGPAQFVFQFCDNHDELAATEVSPDEMAFFNATIEMCMNDDGGHGGGYDACTSAVYNASGCYFSRANMTGIYDKPHPECCAAWSNVQSQCGEPGDSVATVTNMLSKVMLNLDPYTFGYVANMSNYCPAPGQFPSACSAAMTAEYQDCRVGGVTSNCCGSLRAEAGACTPFSMSGQFWDDVIDLADNITCALTPSRMCVESMKAIDRCLHSNGSSTTGACCSLLGVAHFSCAGYPEDFFASESGPGLPPSFYSELAAFILSGSCFGGGGGDDCDFDRVIPQVFRHYGGYVTTNVSFGTGVAYSANGLTYYHLDTTKFSDMYRWTPAYECT